MYQHLLVPLDGSPFGEQALPLAVRVARGCQASLELVHVHVPTIHIGSQLLMDEHLERRARVHEQAYLDSWVQRLRELAPEVTVRSVLVDGGKATSLAAALQEQAQASGADLMVLTTHGRTGLSRMWLGSVADELLRSTTMPLLLLQPRDTVLDMSKEPSLRHVLVPLDGSLLAERILSTLLELAPALGSARTPGEVEYTLLQVVKPVPGVAADPGLTLLTAEQPQMLQAELTAAQEYLERIAARLRRQSLAVHTRVVQNAHLAPAVLSEAVKLDVDLIALATHGRSGLTRLLLGSTADKVMRGAMVPVLLQRPAAE